MRRDPPRGREIVHAMKGHWHGNAAMCCCPAHDDSSPSLSVKQTGDGMVLVHCFGGCPQGAVIQALRERGLWPERDEEGHPSYPQANRTAERDEDATKDELRRIANARQIWTEATPAPGTLVETYLRHRGITLQLRPALRFHPAVYHTAIGRTLPAMVVAIQDSSDDVIGIQRTYLREDGMGKAAVNPNKLGLGPMRDGAVRFSFGKTSPILGIAEGVETALSAMQTYYVPVWAALGAGRMHKVAVPDYVDHVVVYGDNGAAGWAAAEKAAEHFEAIGKRVSVTLPGPEYDDFNSQLRGIRSAA
jgi:hypothetical protein